MFPFRWNRGISKGTIPTIGFLIALALTGCAGAATPTITTQFTPANEPTETRSLSPAPSQTTLNPTSTIQTSTAEENEPPIHAETATAALPVISPEALTYLNEALEILEEHSIYRDQVDWNMVREKVYGSIRKPVEKPSETYPAIEEALTLLRQAGDRHSFFIKPEDMTQLAETTTESFPPPEGKFYEGQFAYLEIPHFGAIHDDEITEHADRIQQIIRELDARRPCGWIVDLRPNQGGNMWPMLAGVGPILGEGQVGAIVDAEGQEAKWFYQSGSSGSDDVVIAEVSGEAYLLHTPSPPVAVLIGGGTASSGEAIAVAFRGRPGTRFFGEQTAGLTTGNAFFELSDGAVINLASSIYVDRTGQQYGEIIMPDEEVKNKGGAPDEVLEAAIEWLRSQEACTTS